MATGQHGRQALKQLRADDDMSISDVVDGLNLNGVPIKETFQLHPNRQSLRVAVMKGAWQAEGRDIQNPGKVDQYWFEGTGFVLLDFNNE